MLKRETHSKCCRLTGSTHVSSLSGSDSIISLWEWNNCLISLTSSVLWLSYITWSQWMYWYVSPLIDRPEASNKEQQVTVVMEPNRLQQERERWSVFVPTEGSRCVFSPLPPSPPHFNRTSVHHSRKLLSGPALYHIHSIIIISVWCVTR